MWQLGPLPHPIGRHQHRPAADVCRQGRPESSAGGRAITGPSALGHGVVPESTTPLAAAASQMAPGSCLGVSMGFV